MSISLPGFKMTLFAALLAGPLLVGLMIKHHRRQSSVSNGPANSADVPFRPHLVKSGRHGNVPTPFAPWESVSGAQKTTTQNTDSIKGSSWYQTVMADITKKSYYMAKDGKHGAVSSNLEQGLQANYNGISFTLSPLGNVANGQLSEKAQKRKKQDNWKFEMQIIGLYADGKLAYAPTVETVQELKEGEADFRVSDELTVQYLNTEAGIRQNFIVEKEPAVGAKELRVSMRVPKNWTVGNEGGKELHFAKHNAKGLDTKIIYKDLKAWDADNKPLVAYMDADNRGGVGIVVASAGARYPVTIDPISTTAATTLTGASGSFFGTSVAAGDVNGDGYSDVVVGATGVSSFSGAAYVYLGSSTGLSTTATTLPGFSGSTFGVSVATGDVNGDGYSDVVVGATGVSSGKGAIYVYLGSSTGISTTGTSRAGTNSNGQFGVSVATADVNGDGYGDVIVGANGVSTNSGAAFVYHGSATGIATSPNQTLTGASSSYFGYCVSSAGDVNGDGYGDIIIGAWNTANAYVYLGASTGIPATAATTLSGGSRFGYSVSGAGDVNGDGYADVVVGAYGVSSNAGAAYIYLGSITGIPTTATATLTGASGSYFGDAVSPAGDVNGDGYGDLAIGAYGASPGGAVYIFQGAATGIASGALPSATLAGAGGSFGNNGTVAQAGDVNGDGISDMVVGAWGANAAYVYLGSPGGISATATSTYAGTSGSGSFGFIVSSAGDVNGDGYGDVALVAIDASSKTGTAYLYLGSATGLSTTAATTLTNLFFISKSNSGSLASAGDVNGDGYGDLVVGANGVSSSTGAAYVYLGSASGLASTASVTLTGPSTGSYFGNSVASAGDVNGDGYGDVVVGAPFASGSGAAYVYLGSPTGLSATAAPALNGPSTNGIFGNSVASAGDVNGDGYGDVVVGASGVSSNTGAAYVYLGSATGLSATAATTLVGVSNGDYFGTSVACAGDVNGDGYSDVVVGAFGVSSSTGATYVYLGSASGLSTTASVTLGGPSAGSNFGISVSSAGDVNGDGYSDVVIGANGAAGAAYIYLGSSTGLATTASATYTGGASGSNFGGSVSLAGDVNGDGYSDLVVGASGVSSNTGAAYLFAGNGGYGKRNNTLRLYETDISTPIKQSNRAATQFGVGLFVAPFSGVTKARIVWETEPAGTGFLHHSPIANYTGYTAGQSSYTAIPAAGTELKSLVAKASGKATKVRLRIQYLSSQLPGGQVFGPWIYPQQYITSGNAGVLPITLLSFGAKASGSSNLVSWQVAEESPNTFYDVERSAAGVSFSKIGTSVSGKGDNSSYTFYDNSPLFPVSYYRLKGTEADGHVTYSDIAAVRRDGAAVTVTVSPNPFTGSVTVTNTDASLNGKNGAVLEMQGRTIASFVINAQAILDTHGWPAGMYLLRLPDGTTKKIVKQ